MALARTSLSLRPIGHRLLLRSADSDSYPRVPAILKLLAGNHVTGVFELSHLSPEVAVGLVEECLQPTKGQLFVPSQQDGGPESGAMLQQVVQLAERGLGGGNLRCHLRPMLAQFGEHDATPDIRWRQSQRAGNGPGK